MKKLKKKQKEFNDIAFVSAVISYTFFRFIADNRKNIFKAYEFIGEMTEMFLKHCADNNYVLGENLLNDKDGIVNWCKDCLREHPSFKDPEETDKAVEDVSEQEKT